jgi:hypothetical protein
MLLEQPASKAAVATVIRALAMTPRVKEERILKLRY